MAFVFLRGGRGFVRVRVLAKLVRVRVLGTLAKLIIVESQDRREDNARLLFDERFFHHTFSGRFFERDFFGRGFFCFWCCLFSGNSFEWFVEWFDSLRADDIIHRFGGET